MITNFEAITEDLTDEEIRLVPVLIAGFKTKTRENPIKAPEIIRRINSKREELGLTKNLTEPRLRKLCNHIRTFSLLPLIATSKGYYSSENPEEIQLQINSLKERAGSILASAQGLEVFLDPKHKDLKLF